MLLNPAALRAIVAPVAGTAVAVRALAVGDGTGTTLARIAGGEALRPPGPVHLSAATTPAGDLQSRWVRRSRLGWVWADELDAPLGESNELYRARIEGSTGTVELETAQPSALFTAAQLAAVGSGPATLSVAQVGDRALSRWSSLPITLP